MSLMGRDGGVHVKQQKREKPNFSNRKLAAVRQMRKQAKLSAWKIALIERSEKNGTNKILFRGGY